MNKYVIQWGGVIVAVVIIVLVVGARGAQGDSVRSPFSQRPANWIGPEGLNFWSYTGPRQEAPQVIQVVIDPTNPSIVYAATNQGVYRSADGGENWEARNGNLGGYGDLVVTGLAIDPTNSQTLIISTWGAGLLKSTNAGVSWVRLSDPLRPALVTQAIAEALEPFPIVAVGPSYSNWEGGMDTIPPGTGKTFPFALARTLRKESDVTPAGMPISWKRTAVRRVTINPANKNEIFACVDDGNGLYRSTDGGASWTKVTLGTGSARTYTFAPSNNQIRYASFGTWGTSGGFYRTTNSGVDWVPVGGTTLTRTVTAVAIHPSNPNIVLAATSGGGLYRSTNGGDSWTRVNDLEDTFFSVAFASSTPNIAYAGGYFWVYISTDGGATWDNADTSFPAWYVEGLAIHPTQPETVFVGSNEFFYGGVYKRTSAINAFARKINGMQETFVLDIEQDPNDSSILYASTWGAGIFRSDNGGVTWAPKNYYDAPYVYDIEAVQGPTSTILYAATFYSDRGILKSYDRGDTWFEVSRDYPSFISFDLQSVGGSPDFLVAATYDGVQYSYDGGVNWYDASGLDTNSGIVMKLCEFPGTNRLLAATYGGGLFYSPYNGYSWYEANVGIAAYGNQYYTFDVACSPTTPGLAYATSLGMYRTTDYGEHWHPINAGVPKEGSYYIQFRNVDIVPVTGDVFAASYNKGVYLAPGGAPIWFDISTGLIEKRMRAIAVVGSSPVRAFAGTNGQGAWQYTLTARPTVRNVYLPLTLRNYMSFYSTTDTYEPNNSFDQAYALPGPGAYYSYLWSASDLNDYYRFDIGTLGPITIDLSNIPSGRDYDLYLYNSNRMKVSMSTWGSNHNEQIVFYPARTGRYYIHVYGYNNSYSSSQAYRLNVSYNGAPGSGDIRGTVTQSGAPVSYLPTWIGYSNGYQYKESSTETDSSGVYHFRGMGSLPVGHTYDVYYWNLEENDARLSGWYCNSFNVYTATTTYNACSFDVANVVAVSPAHDATVHLPVTFQWTRRSTTSDNYRLRLRSSDWSAYWESSALGYADSYTLYSLPPGFTTGTTYRWDVIIVTSGGIGFPYYYRNITFTANEATVIESETGEGIPNDWADIGREMSNKQGPGYIRRFERLLQQEQTGSRVK